MKRLVFIPLITYCSLLTVNCNAQTYVAIPDSNFVHYLKTIVPTAFKGDSLNTSSTTVTTYTQNIICGSSNIANLDGIQYFSSLTHLLCFYNNLTSLPTLPNTLVFLDCGGNHLTALPALPNSLTYLQCNINNLTSLPTLPASINYIECGGNQLTSIPTLPNSLRTFSCEYNNLASLPPLPDSLTTFGCFGNHITCFPTFPNTIIVSNTTFSIDPNPYNCLPNYVPSMTGTSYTATPLCATGNSNGCAVAGIQQVADINNQVTVYPNPAKESLTLTLSQGEGTYSINMYDMLGKEVFPPLGGMKGGVTPTPNPSKEGTITINIADLSEGFYNLCVSTNEGIANKRIVIER